MGALDNSVEGVIVEEPNLPPWKCFHCGEVFTTPGSARDHFGGEFSTPGCLIDRVALEEGGQPERGRGLLMALRKAEAEIQQLHRQVEEAEQAAGLAVAAHFQERRRLTDAIHPMWSVERVIEHYHGNTPEHGGLVLHCPLWPCDTLQRFATHTYTPFDHLDNPPGCIVCGERKEHSHHG